MSIPKYDEIRIPALEYLTKNPEVRLKDFSEPLAIYFSLSYEDKNLEYASGNENVFKDRVSWALSELNIVNFVDKPKRGVYRINENGHKALADKANFDELVKEIQKTINIKKDNQDEVISEKEISGNDLTPQELLYQSFSNIRQTVYDDILDTIASKSPIGFEHLVVKLLEKMGYGGEVKDAGLVTKASNDGGIDGIIKEDVLGLGRIHIQAKRYAKDNSVGREDIQKFVGALAVAQSSKGVFITTSYFTSGAKEYAKNLNGNTVIVLIDGLQLAKYIYDFNLGMQTEETFEIKKLDSDFWDAMPDAV